MMAYVYSIVLLLLMLFSAHRVEADLRDPTRPVDFAPKSGGQTETLHLEAVLISNDRKIAVINGQYLNMGDQIGSNYLVDIQANAVQLEGPSGRIELLLFGKPVKQDGGPEKLTRDMDVLHYAEFEWI